jgi:serine/threonine protein kinase
MYADVYVHPLDPDSVLKVTRVDDDDSSDADMVPISWEARTDDDASDDGAPVVADRTADFRHDAEALRILQHGEKAGGAGPHCVPRLGSHASLPTPRPETLITVMERALCSLEELPAFMCGDWERVDVSKRGFIPYLRWDDIEYLCFRVLECLACAHARYLVHMDMSPRNTLVTTYTVDENGERVYRRRPAHPDGRTYFVDIMLADWGCHKTCDPEAQPRTARMLSRPVNYVQRAYRPPELLTNDEMAAHPSVDLWSAGCWIFDVLCQVRRGHLFNLPNSIADAVHSDQTRIAEFQSYLTMVWIVIGAPRDEQLRSQVEEVIGDSDFFRFAQTPHPGPVLDSSPRPDDMDADTQQRDAGDAGLVGALMTPDSLFQPPRYVELFYASRFNAARKRMHSEMTDDACCPAAGAGGDSDEKHRKSLAIAIPAYTPGDCPLYGGGTAIPACTRRLLFSLLQWNPSDRLSAADCIANPALWTRPIAEIRQHRVPLKSAFYDKFGRHLVNGHGDHDLAVRHFESVIDTR